MLELFTWFLFVSIESIWLPSKVLLFAIVERVRLIFRLHQFSFVRQVLLVFRALVIEFFEQVEPHVGVRSFIRKLQVLSNFVVQASVQKVIDESRCFDFVFSE